MGILNTGDINMFGLLFFFNKILTKCEAVVFHF